MQDPRFDPIRADARYARFDYDDTLDGIRDYMLTKAGREPAASHPLADAFSEKNARLIDLAACLMDRDGRSIDLENAQRNIGPSIGSGHLSTILSTFGAIQANTFLDESARDVQRVCTRIELPDYRLSYYPYLDSTNLAALTGDEGATIEMVRVRASSEPLQIKGRTYKLMFGRHVIENDDRNVVAAAFRDFGTAAGRRMAHDLGDLFDNNANLSDGSAWFNSTDGNDLTSGEVSVTGLQAMTAALRQMETPDGELMNSRPKIVMVPAEWEITAQVLVSAQLRERDPQFDELIVIVNPWLASGYWYLLADPAQAPAIALATLAGANGPLTTSPSARSPSSVDGDGIRTDFDGVATNVHLAYDLAPISRAAIRNTTA
jgi:hypothetical protein